MKQIKKILSGTPFVVFVAAIVCMVILRSILHDLINKEEIVDIPVEEVVVVEQEKEQRAEEMLIIGKAFTDTFEKEKEAEQAVHDSEPETMTGNLRESVPVMRQEVQAADKPAEKAAVESAETESASVAAEIKEDALKACAHGWMFESYYQKPACSSGGLENQICSKCGLRQTTPGTPTGEHVFETEAEGNCVNEELVICIDCNYRETGISQT